MHNDIHLTMATWDYDHVRDLATGMVKPKGIELTHLQMEVEEIFYRFVIRQVLLDHVARQSADYRHSGLY